MGHSEWASRHRFFVDADAISGDVVAFDRERSHQISRVLRIGPNEPFIVLAGDGQERLVRIQDVNPGSCVARVLEQRPAMGEPRLHVTLYQALLPRERFELALSKAIEVGITRFVPLRTERCVARLDDKEWASKSGRLQAIAREAAEQSERGLVPAIEPPANLRSGLKQARASGPALIAWERGERSITRQSLSERVRGMPPGISVFVGPEGGFTPAEIDLAHEADADLLWLGHRILRSETAGAVIAAILLYESGDLGLS